MTGINLESCVNITDKSLKNVADGCPVRLCTKFHNIFLSYYLYIENLAMKFKGWKNHQKN